ncbi:PP2C family protein-serine/threonine phosphatase [Streptomyces mangrovisoli]|uniref:PPM-type phosphatase domain-containing protein n=1 Tax=Streptomyces mangrovisoli TaxID=1428628 RepID=A0A1J4P483_9ACTN|nr:PP2C family protein-serine/threonine phosphatase [Streptomyces mangrovisoli]OIJ69577.1 hypothetical protein WN71_001450 [Streptomyces mangrovisoli]
MRFVARRQDPLARLPRAGRVEAFAQRLPLEVRGHSIAWLVPLLMLVGVAVADWNTSGGFRLISWAALVPAIAAALCPVWITMCFAVLALATYVGVDTAWPHQDRIGAPDLILVAVSGVLSTLACAVRQRGERRLVRIQDIADTTRRTLLRPLPPGFGGLDHAAVYLTADIEARVGGDFYDIQPGPYGTRVVLGDVQGKGLGAVETAGALLGTFREAAYHEADLMAVAGRLEVRMLRHRLHTSALGRDDGDRFATAVLLGFPPDAPETVEFVNFGHDPPLVAGPSGVRRLPAAHGLPLGMSDLAPGTGFPDTVSVRLGAEETLLLTTDGVTEARDPGGTFYPLPDDVARGLASDPRLAEPRRLVAYVRDGTLRHCRGRLSDDTTIFAVRRRVNDPTRWTPHTG